MSREDLWENVQFILKILKAPQIALKAAQKRLFKEMFKLLHPALQLLSSDRPEILVLLELAFKRTIRPLCLGGEQFGKC